MGDVYKKKEALVKRVRKQYTKIDSFLRSKRIVNVKGEEAYLWEVTPNFRRIETAFNELAHLYRAPSSSNDSILRSIQHFQKNVEDISQKGWRFSWEWYNDTQGVIQFIIKMVEDDISQWAFSQLPNEELGIRDTEKRLKKLLNEFQLVRILRNPNHPRFTQASTKLFDFINSYIHELKLLVLAHRVFLKDIDNVNDIKVESLRKARSLDRDLFLQLRNFYTLMYNVKNYPAIHTQQLKMKLDEIQKDINNRLYKLYKGDYSSGEKKVFGFFHSSNHPQNVEKRFREKLKKSKKKWPSLQEAVTFYYEQGLFSQHIQVETTHHIEDTLKEIHAELKDLFDQKQNLANEDKDHARNIQLLITFLEHLKELYGRKTMAAHLDITPYIAKLQKLQSLFYQFVQEDISFKTPEIKSFLKLLRQEVESSYITTVEEHFPLEECKCHLYYDKEKFAKTRTGILFLHGSTYITQMYEPLFSRLVSQGFLVLGVDLPGHQGTKGKYRLGLIAEKANKMVDWLRTNARFPCEKVGVIGHSIGGLATLFNLIGYNQQFENYFVERGKRFASALKKAKVESLYKRIHQIEKNPNTFQRREITNLILQNLGPVGSDWKKLKETLNEMVAYRVKSNASVDAVLVIGVPSRISELIEQTETMLLNPVTRVVGIQFLGKLIPLVEPLINKNMIDTQVDFDVKKNYLGYLQLKGESFSQFADYLRHMPDPNLLFALITIRAEYDQYFAYLKKYVQKKPLCFVYGQKDQYLFNKRREEDVVKEYKFFIKDPKFQVKKFEKVDHSLDSSYVWFRGRSMKKPESQDFIVNYFVQNLLNSTQVEERRKLLEESRETAAQAGKVVGKPREWRKAA